MKSHYKMLLGGLLSVAIVCVSAAAQITGTTVSVSFSPTGVYYYPGEAVTVNYSVSVSLKKSANFTASGEWTCYVDGVLWQGFPKSFDTISQLNPFTDSGSFTVTESSAGTYSVSCQVSGQLSGIGTFSGSSTQSFTVTGCTGNSDYSEQDTESGGYETTTFTLSAIMNPPYSGPQTAIEYGYGITGNLAGTKYALDCDGAVNDDLPEEYATIADDKQTQEPDGSILFEFTITNYQYTATGCDECDTNPSGYYPVSYSSYTTQVQFQAYCGTAK